MRREVFVQWAAVSAIAVALLLLWVETSWRGDTATLAAVDLGNLLAAGLAAAACAARSRRERVAGNLAAGRGWGFLAAACVCWTVGILYVSYYDLVAHAGVPFEERAIPFPSIADAGYLLFVPLALFGVALMPRGVFSNRRRIQHALDGGMVALSLLAIVWVVLMRNVWMERGEASAFETVLLMAYPFGDILLAATAVIAWEFVPREERGNVLLLVVGLGLLAIADIGFSILVLRDAVGISAINVLWPAGFAAIALAAVRPADALTPSRDPQGQGAMLPLTAAAALLAMGLSTVSNGLQPGVAVLFVLLTGLAGARFLLDLQERRVARSRSRSHAGEARP